MKHWILAIALVATPALAEDNRQLAPMSPAAQESLRSEMRDNLVALNQVLSLMANGKLQEAGELAEASLGISAMGKHRTQPIDARPGLQMPADMHQIGRDGHRAASEFARAAAAGDRDAAMARLPGLTSACVACHHSYRIR